MWNQILESVKWLSVTNASNLQRQVDHVQQTIAFQNTKPKCVKTVIFSVEQRGNVGHFIQISEQNLDKKYI